MLYVFFGNDTTHVRQEALKKAQALCAEDDVSHITSAEYRPGILVEEAGSTSLFGGVGVTILDTLSEDTEAFAVLLRELSILADSARHFIVIEGGLVAAEKKVFQKHAVACEECVAEKKERFNAFSLTDAFLARDKKTLWLLLSDALRAGLSPEEIIGVLFWQIKTARLVLRTPHADEAGLKPFVYSKAQRARTKFSSEELDQLSRSLVTLYHEGHSGKKDIAHALEAWVLSL